MRPLPVELVDRIFRFADIAAEEEAEEGSHPEQRRRELGLAVSLVCRDWQERGTKLVWRRVCLNPPDQTGLLEHLLACPRAVRAISNLSIAWAEPHLTPTPIEHRLHDILRTCTSLTSLSIAGPPPAALLRIAPVLPFLPRLSDLVLNAVVDDPCKPHVVLSQLQLLLSLKHLFLSLRHRNAPLGEREWVRFRWETPNLLPLRSLNLSLSFFHQNDEAAANYKVCRRADPQTLKVLRLHRTLPQPTLFSWIGTCRNLTVLHLHFGYRDAFLVSIPTLSPALSRLTNLRQLDIAQNGREPEDDEPVEAALLQQLLDSLPLSLEIAGVDLPFPGGEHGVPLAPFLAARRPSRLWHVSFIRPKNGGVEYAAVGKLAADGGWRDLGKDEPEAIRWPELEEEESRG